MMKTERNAKNVLEYMEDIQETCAFLKKQGLTQAPIGVILGTGIGEGFLKKMQIEVSLEYKDIPGFPLATLEFHSGKLHYGCLHGTKKKMIVLQGRFHFYEGYSMQEITFPVRVLKCMGAQYLLISNAAGNMNRKWRKGELMLLQDHINLQPENPLRGPNINSMGPRFPDMSAPYSAYLNERLLAAAQNGKDEKGEKIILREGVYVCVPGPSLETRAEYRFLQGIGADAVGMSTVPEVIVSAHMKLDCCAVSVLTDDCDPDNLHPVSIEDIIAVAGQAEKKLAVLYEKLILQL